MTAITSSESCDRSRRVSVSAQAGSSEVFYAIASNCYALTEYHRAIASCAMAEPIVIEESVGPPNLAVGAFTLRAMRLDDATAWFDYLRSPGVVEHTSFPAVERDSVRGWVERAMASYASQGPYRWALVNREDMLVGTCGFSNWSLIHGHAELAYDLNPEYQHQGLMSCAVTAVIRWAFSQQPLHRIHAYVMTSNRPSIALLERNGFDREGTLRAFRIARGTPRDFFLYARLKDAIER